MQTFRVSTAKTGSAPIPFTFGFRRLHIRVERAPLQDSHTNILSYPILPMLAHLIARLLSWALRIRLRFGKYLNIHHSSAIDNSEEPRATFWREWTRGLDYLLARASYSDALRRHYVAFFNDVLTPLFGPSPSEFLGSAPSSFLSDDHTPFELIWAIGRRGNMSVRFAFEPLSTLDGSSLPPSKSMASLSSLRGMPGLDLTWSNTCRRTLLFDPPEACVVGEKNSFLHSSQFFLGGDLEHDCTIVGKVYFLPYVRAALEGVSDFSLVNNCMSELGLEDSWGMAYSHIQSIAEISRPTIAMVAVDCIEPSRNRAKVYVRTQGSTSFSDIVELLTLGGKISDSHVVQTVAAMRHLWRLLFPGVGDDTPLSSKRGPEYYPTGFLIYYEMALGRAVPIPKVYIPVRHYCDSDSHVAAALSQYFKDIKLQEIGERYEEDLKQMFTHRDLAARTGIHTYVGICTKSSDGPAIYHYLSPEVFAPERQTAKY
ncbi:putative dimethyl allyl transferase [Mycena venus]|uniref:Putative dimethyl allyl transferase n=1 Tax=Mycena venus TaxID=2733690 RepID=A0A8H7CEY1_9AGAR|nr:putative dimethyl allyl transferase [Mycena venus]